MNLLEVLHPFLC